ncbi:MAG: peptidoglycan editing factor PgeF [Gammaproteobacteria bacterium]|nr:MAG: peptidoglycan editing factor PgeF [Gammaproteobacteria bacterium]
MNNNQAEMKWLAANWHAPSHIHAGTTMRYGGMSTAPDHQLNLGMHVKDGHNSVLKNRQRLSRYLKLPAEPVWLNQVHGNSIIQIDSQVDLEITDKTADGSYSREANKVCVVTTADCLPLLLCDDEGAQIAAIHIGWRGFSKNIISVALEKFACAHDKLMAWLGPCISADHYEIDATVFNASKKIFAGAEECFIETCMGHWLMDLKLLVSKQLITLEVGHIYTSPYCTYSDQTRFFSHRRDGTTRRMASLIWIDSQSNMG